MNRECMFFFVMGFAIGIILSVVVSNFFDKKLPEAFTIEREGEIIGIANTNPKLTEYVNLKGTKSPGEYVAFPIYKANEAFLD